MSFEVKTTSDFDRSAKNLAKRYRSFKADLRDLIASLEANPDQGTELSPGIRKIRMTISSKITILFPIFRRLLFGVAFFSFIFRFFYFF